MEERKIEGNEAAAHLAMNASSEEAREYLREQTRLARLQSEQIEEENVTRRRMLKLEHSSAVFKLLLELAVAAVITIAAIALGAAVWSAASDNGLVVESFAVPPDLRSAASPATSSRRGCSTSSRRCNTRRSPTARRRAMPTIGAATSRCRSPTPASPSANSCACCIPGSAIRRASAARSGAPRTASPSPRARAARRARPSPAPTPISTSSCSRRPRPSIMRPSLIATPSISPITAATRRHRTRMRT